RGKRLLDRRFGGGGDVLGLLGRFLRRLEREVLADLATLLVHEHGHDRVLVQAVLGRAVLIFRDGQRRGQLVRGLELVEVAASTPLTPITTVPSLSFVFWTASTALTTVTRLSSAFWVKIRTA